FRESTTDRLRLTITAEGSRRKSSRETTTREVHSKEDHRRRRTLLEGDPSQKEDHRTRPCHAATAARGAVKVTSAAAGGHLVCSVTGRHRLSDRYDLAG
ncbi:hypothetical protein LSAT2_017628, partial [Lamellibrachia satsuma]